MAMMDPRRAFWETNLLCLFLHGHGRTQRIGSSGLASNTVGMGWSEGEGWEGRTREDAKREHVDIMSSSLCG